MVYDQDAFLDQIILHEGLELTPYKCTAGYLTIGVGRNLDDRGITEDEARFLCKNDIKIVERELGGKFPFITGLGDARIRVLLDMAFNLGVERDFEEAAKDMLDSSWASQVGQRAQRLATAMRTGKLQIP